MTSNAVFNPTCSGCGKRMGDMTEEEFLALVRSDGLGSKCFDCSPDEADAIPDFFEDMHRGEIITMGDSVFVACDTSPVQLVQTGFSSRACERALSVCLSSSTNLNGTNPNHGGNVPVIETNAKCPNCGVERMFEAETFRECQNCDYQELKPDTVFLPAWVVDFDGVLVAKNDSDLHCTDCLTVQSSGRGSYCVYHHALLIEQKEDGVAGYGNE